MNGGEGGRGRLGPAELKGRKEEGEVHLLNFSFLLHFPLSKKGAFTVGGRQLVRPGFRFAKDFFPRKKGFGEI